MDIIIHRSSNQPYDHKLAAFKYYINRMVTLPITEQAAKQEWEKIIAMAHNNGFPEQTVPKLRKKQRNKRDRPMGTQQPQQSQQCKKRCINFTYYGPAIRKVTNLFRQTNLQIAFRPTNTIYQQLFQKGTTNNNPSGIYQLKCNTCKEVYVGQSGRPINTRYKEPIRYISHNNPTSAYATHILNNRHEFGPVEETLKLLKPCTKGTRMNCWEALYMHLHHKRSTLISEQQVNDTNTLFDLAYIPRDLQHIL